jgi:hypothetical protein
MPPARVTLTSPAGVRYTELLDPGDRLHFHRMSHRWDGEAQIAWTLDDGLLRINDAVVGAELPDLEPGTLASWAARHPGALQSIRLVKGAPLTAEAVAGLAALAAEPLWLDLQSLWKMDLNLLSALGGRLRGLLAGKLTAAQARRSHHFNGLELLSVREPGDAQLEPLCALPSLRILELVDADVTAASLQRLADLTSLRELAILYKPKKNRPGGLEAIAPLTGLTRLRFWNFPATDDDLRHLAGLGSLRYLHLHGAAITDAGLSHLTRLTALDQLHLPGAAITDAGVEHLARLSSLTRLYIVYTRITPEGVARLRAALPGCTIDC